MSDAGQCGEMRHGEPLSRHTGWRVGGAARRLYRPAKLWVGLSQSAGGSCGTVDRGGRAHRGFQRGAQVSEKHANFIINTGNASAADIAALIERIRTEVGCHSGVRLVPEVCRVGGEQR